MINIDPIIFILMILIVIDVKLHNILSWELKLILVYVINGIPIPQVLKLYVDSDRDLR